jgi:hypothetical protein
MDCRKHVRYISDGAKQYSTLCEQFSKKYSGYSGFFSDEQELKKFEEEISEYLSGLTVLFEHTYRLWSSLDCPCGKSLEVLVKKWSYEHSEAYDYMRSFGIEIKRVG